MKTVLGYSPYQQAGMPKGPLLIGLIVLIGFAGLIAGVAGSVSSDSSPASTSTGSSTASALEVADNIAQMDYATGYMMGQMNLVLYPAISVTQEAVICRASYQADLIDMRTAPEGVVQVSELHYMAGCQDAMGRS